MTTVKKVHAAVVEVHGKSSVRALVSVFGNVDLQGDRVMPGSFQHSIAAWKASGDPVPFIWSHDWTNPFAHVGTVRDLRETSEGLQVVAEVDKDADFARQVLKLLQQRRVREFSFAYDVIRERKAEDGATNLYELKIIEVGPTLRGANPQTELIDAKGLQAMLAKERGRYSDAAVLRELDRLAPSVETRVNALHDERLRREVDALVREYLDSDLKRRLEGRARSRSGTRRRRELAMDRLRLSQAARRTVLVPGTGVPAFP